MAKLYPDYQQILNGKVKPEPGELHLLDFLLKHLNDSYEIYFNPYLNGDRPDVVILRKGFGVLIIEVKDYNLQSYKLDSKKNWILRYNNTKIKSPISQVLKYKENLYSLHIPKLLEKQIRNIRYLNVVNCAVYFHNADSYEVNNLIVDPFSHDDNYQKFLRYNINLLGNDNLNEIDFNRLLTSIKLNAANPQALFDDELYVSFKRFLSPPIHLRDQGKKIQFSRQQLDIIHSRQREQRIKGVVGSGKTTVLAARAVQAFKRTKSRVLVLTYNITLKNYLHDKISDVREEFPWEGFAIMNYHNFINHELNNLGVLVEVPESFDNLLPEEKELYFEKKYYSNKELFEEKKDSIVKFDSIFIDEIQDYKRAWMEIIKEYYLADGGEYVLFGDVKQNIYNNQTEGRDVSTNVRGVIQLKNCFRSDFKIKDLAINFQENLFGNKYEIDDFNLNPDTGKFDFPEDKQGYVNYMYLQDTDNVTALYNIIHQNILNKNYIPNDITILGHSISLLKAFDRFYRYSCNELTNSMFESSETIYTIVFNKNNLPQDSLYAFLRKAIKLIKRDSYSDTTASFEYLGKLFTIYDLYLRYGSKFNSVLNWYCTKFKTSSSEFITFMEAHQSDLQIAKEFYNIIENSNTIKRLRSNKKLHFWMNSGTIKISTIHSFKGWESETIFLIVENYFDDLEQTFDELLYTGLTRSKRNLIIINFGNAIYHTKIKGLIEKVNTK